MTTKQHNSNPGQRMNMAWRVLGAESQASRSHSETEAFAAQGNLYPAGDRSVVATDSGCDGFGIGQLGLIAEQLGPAKLA